VARMLEGEEVKVGETKRRIGRESARNKLTIASYIFRYLLLVLSCFFNKLRKYEEADAKRSLLKIQRRKKKLTQQTGGKITLTTTMTTMRWKRGRRKDSACFRVCISI